MLARSPKPIGAAPFKQAMRALVGGVTVLATQDRAGASVGLTATAVTSLSADPPSLIVCVNRQATIAEALVEGADFSVNVLAADQADVAQAFGGQRAVRGPARFAFGGWFRGPHGVPLLMGARIGFECTVAQRSEWATHLIVIGTVMDVQFINPTAKPLAYHDGRYVTLD